MKFIEKKIFGYRNRYKEKLVIHATTPTKISIVVGTWYGAREITVSSTTALKLADAINNHYKGN